MSRARHASRRQHRPFGAATRIELCRGRNHVGELGRRNVMADPKTFRAVGLNTCRFGADLRDVGRELFDGVGHDIHFVC
jgi:hypothetical protein